MSNSTGMAGLYNNAYTQNLIVCDAEYTNSVLSGVGENLETEIKNYISVLTTLSTKCSGALAENFLYFAKTVDMLLGNVIQGVFEQEQNCMNRYVSTIDKSDDALY